MGAHDLWLLSPELAMAALAVALVVVDLAFRQKRVVTTLAFLGLAVPLAFVVALWTNPPAPETGLFGSLAADRFALFFDFLFIGVAAATVLASAQYASKFSGFRGEYYSLILFSVTGMMLLASASELISIYIALELTALPLAALAAFLRTDRSSEAGLKFLLLGAVSSAILLYGLVFIYGFTGTTVVDEIFSRIGELSSSGALDATIPFGSYALLFGVVLVVAGFAFKLAAVPFQMWAPDVYEGAPTPVTAFLSVASKAAGFAVVLRILYAAFGSPEMSLDWSGLFAALAAASMTVGNLMALTQRNIKRLLAYSTIAHAGYMLVGVAAVAASTSTGASSAGPQGVLFYLTGYAFTNLAAFFAVIAITNRTGNDMISGFAGMARRSPGLALLLSVGMLSLLGLPPTVGFMGKAYVFSAAVDANLTWLAVLAMINSVVSAYYYLRVVRTMYLDAPESEARFGVHPPLGIATGVAALGVGVFGVAPWFLLRFAELAIGGLAHAAGGA